MKKKTFANLGGILNHDLEIRYKMPQYMTLFK